MAGKSCCTKGVNSPAAVTSNF